MNDSLKELINYRISRALETQEEASILFDNEHWNACINRLYYACFYAVNALLVKHGFSSAKHSGVRTIFNKEFIKTNKLPRELGILFK